MWIKHAKPILIFQIGVFGVVGEMIAFTTDWKCLEKYLFHAFPADEIFPNCYFIY